MKRILIVHIVFIALMISCKETKKTELVQEEPIALYEDLEGNQLTLDDFKGKRLVLNYWATWCRPCIEEMPAMARAQELLKNDGYVFLFASDQSAKKITTFRDQRKFGLDFIKYNGTYADLQINALPLTLIYNEAGQQVERIEGGMIWDAPEMIKKLKQLH